MGRGPRRPALLWVALIVFCRYALTFVQDAGLACLRNKLRVKAGVLMTGAAMA